MMRNSTKEFFQINLKVVEGCICFNGSGQDACNMEAYLDHIGIAGTVNYEWPWFRIIFADETMVKKFPYYFWIDRHERAIEQTTNS